MKKKGGMIVETQSGIKGRTKNGEELIKKKVRVYTDEGKDNLLCDPKSLTPIGYWD